MARVSPYQGNFGSGEFSPLVRGRTDADRYKSGLARCFNIIPTLQGGATHRAGTKYVVNAKINAYTRSIPFKFSQNDAFLLEFGVNYIRFFKNRAPVFSSGTTPYELATVFSQNDLQNIKYTQSLDVLYLVVGTQQPYKLYRLADNSWVIEAIQFQNGPYGLTTIFPGIGGPRLQAIDAATVIGVPFTGTAISTIANVITGVINDGSGQCLITVTDAIAYMVTNKSQVVVASVVGTTGANGTYYITRVPNQPRQLILNGSVFNAAYTSGGTARDNNFISSFIGIPGFISNLAQNFRFILTGTATLWHSGTVNYVYRVGGQVQGFSLVTDIAPGSNTEITEYRVPAWGVFELPDGLGSTSLLTSYPTCVNFFEDRLYFGGAGGALQRIDGSCVSDYENFAPTDFAQGSTTDNTVITDSSAVSFSLLSNQSNIVQWMTSDEKGMCIGTSGGPWVMRPSTLSEAITPTNISAKQVTTFGASKFSAAVAGKASIFIEASLRRIRELAYFYDVDGFRADDLSELAEHLPAFGISTELAFQNIPQNIVWCARNDGALLGITYDRTLDTLRTGWHQHHLGGVSDASGTPPIVESIAVIPAPDGTYDDVWMTVKRYVNGTTFRSIEYMTKIFEVFNDPEDAFFMDCGGTYDLPVAFTSASNASAVITITKTAHGLATGDQIRFRKVTGFADALGNSLINKYLFTVTVLTADTFTVTLSQTPVTGYVNNGLSVYRKMVHTISGLSWLEGQTVQVLGDGADLGDFVVSSGAITLPGIGAGTVQVGLGYSAELQQLRLEAGAQDGTSFGKLRRINEVQFMVDRTATFEYGVNFNQMFQIDIRKPSDPIDQAPPLFTGILDQLNPAADYDLENQIAIRQTRPLPFTLLAIMPQQVTQDKG